MTINERAEQIARKWVDEYASLIIDTDSKAYRTLVNTIIGALIEGEESVTEKSADVAAIRDVYAGLAMQAMIGRVDCDWLSNAEVSEYAYNKAEAMMKERSNRHGNDKS